MTFNTANYNPQQQPVDERAEKRKEIREYHKAMIKDLGVSESNFTFKMAFYDKSLNDGKLYIGVFASEFKMPKGVFFEIVTRNYQSTDRKIYRIAPNDYFEDEYVLNEKNSYLVPLEEAKVISPVSTAIILDDVLKDDDTETNTVKPWVTAQSLAAPTIPAYQAPAPMEDSLYSQMTIRDYFAIHTGRPVSTKTWLNELIKNNK